MKNNNKEYLRHHYYYLALNYFLRYRIYLVERCDLSRGTFSYEVFEFKYLLRVEKEE